MSIQDIRGNIKRIFDDFELFVPLLLILVAGTSFGLGRLSVLDTEYSESISPEAGVSILRSSVSGEGNQGSASEPRPVTGLETSQVSEQGTYVASKNGSKYHLPWCGGASRIKDENKVWFQNKADAEAAGYTPAANCKGI